MHYPHPAEELIYLYCDTRTKSEGEVSMKFSMHANPPVILTKQ